MTLPSELHHGTDDWLQIEQWLSLIDQIKPTFLCFNMNNQPCLLFEVLFSISRAGAQLILRGTYRDFLAAACFHERDAEGEAANNDEFFEGRRCIFSSAGRREVEKLQQE